MTTRYDAIIIGAGQAGFPLAGRLAGAGWKTALIEKDVLGGTCVNRGCSPTKTVVASARAAYMARRAADFGVQFSGPVTMDMKVVKARQQAIVDQFRSGLENWLHNLDNLDVIYGHAEFETANSVRVNGELLEADNFFINTGARPFAPPIPGLDEVDYLDSTGLLQIDFLPEHLVIIGGSYIGLEFGQAYRRFGSQVTIVEMQDRLIGREDRDISQGVLEIVQNEGVNVRLNAACIQVGQRDGQVVVGVACEEGPPEILGSHLLVAAGRKPNSDKLGLDKVGVEVTGRGHIVVDDKLRTSVPHIYALGDVNGKGAFTHTSWNDFEIVAANLLEDGSRRASDRILTYGLYIDPPLGRVGMTEQQARESGRNVLMGVKPMSHIARAKERDETQGLMKVLVDADTERFLGAAILGIGGDEIVHAITDLMYADAPYTVMKNAIHIHPTVSELLPTLLGELKPLE